MILLNNSNIWINANAGSGKTFVLIKRILSLILSGADVNKIVAITYTNVGAQEIYDRFLAAALRWSTIDQDLLIKELGELIEKVDDNTIQIAKNLHNNIMLNGNDLQVGTIHSFCQSILEQISLQSNGAIECFNIDNDAINGTAIETVTDKTLEYLDSMATANANNEIVSKYILGDLSREQIRKMIENIIKTDFSGFNNHDIENIFNISQVDKDNNINNTFFEKISGYNLIAISDSLAISDPSKHDKMLKWLNLDEQDRILYIDFLCNVFLTKEGEPFKRNPIKGKPEEGGFAEISLILKEYLTKKNDVLMYYSAMLLPELASFVKNEFESIKNTLKVWGYDDILEQTIKTLKNQENTWALYNLSYKIEHLLLDEAQDTNKKSWEIIQLLTEDFFVGKSAIENNRTIFIVGDEKQSIYSFQGAEFSLFNQKKELFKKLSKQANIPFTELDLNTSYRSNKAILDIIDKICNDEVVKNAITTQKDVVRHKQHHLQDRITNSVEVIEVDLVKKEQPQTLIEKINIENTAENHLIEATHKAILMLHDQGFKNEDIMILLRSTVSKNNIMFNLVNYLHDKGVDVISIGKINVNEHLIFHDFLSMVSFANDPTDELNLVRLLGSCFCSISFEQIDRWCKDKIQKGVNLWDKILETETGVIMKDFLNNANTYGIAPAILTFIEKYNITQKATDHTGASGALVLSFLMETILSQEFSIISNMQMLDKLRNINSQIESGSKSKEEAIRISTVHGAKGLESKAVIIIDVTENITSGRKIQKGDLFAINDQNICIILGNYKQSALQYYVKQQKQCDATEEMRLLYVAITRAKDKIMIISNKTELDEENTHKKWSNIIKSHLPEEAITSI